MFITYFCDEFVQIASSLFECFHIMAVFAYQFGQTIVERQNVRYTANFNAELAQLFNFAA